MSKTLSVSRVVNVAVNLQPLAAARRNFGILLIIGESDVIGQDERIRSYTGIEGVAADFGSNAEMSPEYAAAELFFSQTPRPSILQIGRWIRAAAPAILRGGILDASANASANASGIAWASITDGTFKLNVCGTEQTVADLDFSGVTNMNGVAAVIDAGLTHANCRWDKERLVITSTATGASATLGFMSAGNAGTNIAGLLGLDETRALPPVDGADAESPAECVAALADLSGEWYGVSFAAASLTVADHLAVAAFVEAASKARVYGVTLTDSRVLDATFTDDIASRLAALKRKRTIVAYSRNPYAIISAMGRAFTVNFSANASTITLKFKQLPGVAAEGLTETQARALAAKRCNVFASYDNDTAIFQEGVMAGDAYFDEIHGLDWLQNAVQTEVWNLLYQAKTKVPQTNGGVNQIVACIESVFGEAVRNRLIAPGVWNADGFGQIERGDHLPKGYYLYALPVELQPQSEREQRKAPVIQCAVKLAGAIHSVDVQIDVNR